jgi:uncharacterized protein (TIGR02246 family)
MPERCPAREIDCARRREYRFSRFLAVDYNKHIRRIDMRKSSLILSLVLTLLVAGCGQQLPGKAADTSADTAAIRAGVDKFVAAWNKGDSAAYGPMIAGDAILIPPDGPLVTGRDAIVAGMAKDYDTTKAQQTATVDEVIVTGDHAYARGTWSITPITAAGADTQAMSGRWSIFYQRGADGTWLTSRWMWNQEAAPKPPGS